MYPQTSDLLTRWIDGAGAVDIMVAAGIMPHKIPIPWFCVSRRDRETYLRCLLLTIGYAVGERSANPAAFVEGAEEDGYYSHAEMQLKRWAKRSARQLEKILESL
jgi:hypothetical protein